MTLSKYLCDIREGTVSREHAGLTKAIDLVESNDDEQESLRPNDLSSTAQTIEYALKICISSIFHAFSSALFVDHT